MTLDEMIEELQNIRNEIKQGDVVVTDEYDMPIYVVGFCWNIDRTGYEVFVSTQPH